MSGLNLSLQAATVPFGTALPGNAQAVVNLVAQYARVIGGGTFNGINYGSATPAPSNRSLPWFKTDTLGNPIGLYSWNGLAWAPIPILVASGTTAQRPSNPTVGTLFWDTTIGCQIAYVTQGWTTASGSVGDLKEVSATSLTTALNNNPGWAQDAASVGRVVAAAGNATGSTSAHNNGDVVGEESHTMQITELVSHTHNLQDGVFNGQFQNGPQGAGIYPITTATTPLQATQAAGGGSPFNVMQPTIYYWRLIKVF